MFAKSKDLMLAAVVTAVTTLALLENVPLVPLKWVLGILLVLVLPGFALVSAIFPVSMLNPSPPSGDYPGVLDRAVFSLIVSISLVIIGGLILNGTSRGLRESTWVLWLAGVTGGGLVVAAWRREPLRPEQRSHLSLGISRLQAILLALTLIITVSAFQVARISAERQKYAGFTQLWLTRVPHMPASSAQIGVRNLEGRPETYTVRVSSRRRILAEWRSIRIQTGGSWTQTLALQDRTKTLRRVTIRLFRGQSRQVYRYVDLRP